MSLWRCTVTSASSNLSEVTVSLPNSVFYENVVNQSQANVTDLPKGTKITLTVTGLTNNNTLEGDKETNVSYTGKSGLLLLTVGR